MTPESIARTSGGNHGTDAYWANYVGAAEAVIERVAQWLENREPYTTADDLREELEQD